MTTDAFSSIPHPSQLPTFCDTPKDKMLLKLKRLLKECAIHREQLLTTVTDYTGLSPLNWQPMRDLEAIQAKISEFWRPIDHLQSVAYTETLKKDHQEGIALITQWETELAQDQRFYQWIKHWSLHADYEQLESAQQKIIHHLLNDFQLAGIDLTSEKKKRYEELMLTLAQQSTEFESNIINASKKSDIIVWDHTQLQGLSERVVQAAEVKATKDKGQHWCFKLNAPTLQAVMTNAKDRALRESFYKAWVTRASQATAFDNSEIMYEILKNKHELSQLTQFQHYAERSLADNKMATTPQAVINFLHQLLAAARPKAAQELQELASFAHQQGHTGELRDWDIAYFSEKLRKQRFNIEQEQLRAYFPLPHVLTTFFEFLHKQFELTLTEIVEQKAWNEAVKVLEVKDSRGVVRGYLYLDLYARANKRSGAWVQEYTQRRLCDHHTLQLPIGFLTCNFAPPFQDEPALLTHDDVVTLFHEMGHALHHTLTQVNYAAVSGIAGVPWDAVELPSQLLEQFAWEPLVLSKISSHYQSHQPLSPEAIQALKASSRFQTGLHLIRQLEFALFDFQLHLHFNPQQGSTQIQHCLDQVRQKTRLLPIPEYNRFQNSFSHIFSGGYDAGYYSYLWAEVLAIDAYSRFVEEGLKEDKFNPQVGKELIESILELGGSVDILELFKRFRKREPSQKAFLNHWGL